MVALCLVGAACWWMNYKVQIVTERVIAEGEVISFGVKSENGVVYHQPSIKFYLENGDRALGFLKEFYKKGVYESQDRVTVLYKRNDPSDIIIYSTLHTYGFPGLALVLSLALTGAVLFYIKKQSEPNT